MKQRRIQSVLSLAFDGSRVDAAVMRRGSGTVEIGATASFVLSLNLLTHEPELVGQEIRQALDAAGIRERRCVVALPQSWTLSLQAQIPPLTGPDLEGLLQMEAERGFSAPSDSLSLGVSRFNQPDSEGQATLVGVPRESLDRLAAVLRAARLIPVGFSLGLPVLHSLSAADHESSLSLCAGTTTLGLVVGQGRGVAALRTLDNVMEGEGTARQVNPQILLRELRITLGQLPVSIRQPLRSVRVFGANGTADRLAADLKDSARTLGLHVERVSRTPSERLGLRLPDAAKASPQIALGASFLSSQSFELEFLPPQISLWKQLAGRFSTRRLAPLAALLALVLVAVIALFGVQQWKLRGLQGRWDRLATRVRELEDIQQQIRTYRPWFDESFRHLNAMKRLTEAFPEDGSVTAKTVEMRETGTVVCSGTARDVQSLYRALDALRATREVSDLQVDQVRGKAPLQFSFNFHFGERTQP